jgi:hypothetical protein
VNPYRDSLSEALFALHEAAMDAANDPTRETINRARKAYRAMERLLPPFYAAELAALRAKVEVTE